MAARRSVGESARHHSPSSCSRSLSRMDVAALVIACCAAAAAVWSAWFTRRATRASERSAAAADASRRASQEPQLTVRVDRHYVYGPSMTVRLESEDLDGLVLEVAGSDHASDEPGVAGLSYLGQRGPRIELGPIRCGEVRLIAVIYTSPVDGKAIRLRCEAHRGADRWVFFATDEFPRRTKFKVR